MTVSVHLSLSSSFLDSAQSLLKEAGTSLAQFGVCDNIDLPTILQVVTGVDVLSIDDRSRILRGDQVGFWSMLPRHWAHLDYKPTPSFGLKFYKNDIGLFGLHNRTSSISPSTLCSK